MRKLLLVFSVLLMVKGASAQSYQGFANSNYGGTNSAYFNPSALADNRFYFYANLVNADLNFSNSYISFNPSYPMKYLHRQVWNTAVKGKAWTDYVHYTNSSGTTDSQQVFADSYLHEELNGKEKDVNLMTEVRGISLMLAWDNKNTVAFNTRMRAGLQVNNISEPLARLGRFGLQDTAAKLGLFNKVQSDNAFTITAGAYYEMALSYGREIINHNAHYLKGGITVKRLFGIGAVVLQNKQLGVQFYNNDSLVATQTDISYAYVHENYYFGLAPDAKIDGNSKFDSKKIMPGQAPGKGWGMDIGATYEYRPDYKTFEYMMDGKKRTNDRKNKYLYKVGFAITDIGNIKYKVDGYTSYRQLNKNTVQNVKDGKKWAGLRKLKPNNSAYIDSAANHVFGFESTANEFTWALPTAMNINFDFKLREHVYISGVVSQSMRKVNALGLRSYSYLSVTPRVEWRWFEFSIPFMAANNYRQFAMGAYMRLGPIFLGSDNLGGILGLSSLYGMDFYAGATVPIGRKKVRDRDKDGVSDRRDKCVRVPGTWEQHGCPDTDGDGIEDSRDKCPNQAGDPKLMGCPDTDGDGVIDELDQCPKNAGPIEKKGCPDKDNDGVFDFNDQCPDQQGPPDLDGCPDTDKDGVKDSQDECPNVAGPAANKGCPDTDGDGVLDKNDECPTEKGTTAKGCPDNDNDGIANKDDKCPDNAGLAKLNGCPDRDLDGVADNDDKCPDTYGDIMLDGCPLVKVEEKTKSADLNAEEQDILKQAFEDLEFATGKSLINETSGPNLDKLAEVLKKHPEFKLQVSGHTDNVGNAAKNLKLSADRAASVKTYLVTKGVSAKQITTAGYGDKRPVAANDTDAGRQKNRRVELKIIK
jgi:outer membrane protein OmpA-like peptidoglycan-associated protein